MKNERQNKILEIITRENIETQEQLLERLQSYGIVSTQATISRDIKELRVVKMLDGNGIYRYAVGLDGKGPKTLKYRDLFAHSVISVVYSMNDVVIKCHSGMAQGACAALDMMHLENVLGTIAGDDTIFVITKTEADAEKLCKNLTEVIA